MHTVSIGVFGQELNHVTEGDSRMILREIKIFIKWDASYR